MKRLAFLLLLLATPALAVDYPIIAGRLPWDGVTVQIWPSTINPLAIAPGFNGVPQSGGVLVVFPPVGADEVLVDPGSGGHVMDPQLSDDAAWLYYTKRLGLTGKWDIYRLNLATRVEEKITSGGNNIGPCINGNQLTFSSDRDGFHVNGNFVGPGGVRGPCFLSFAADLDGKNVERIDTFNLGGALHNEVIPHNGRQVFSTAQTMGGRGSLNWGLWATERDGTDFEPLFSAYFGRSMHFHCFKDGKLYAVPYYPPRNGTGSLVEFDPYPVGNPAPPSRFVSVARTGIATNPIHGDTFTQHFMTTGSRGLTTFATGQDNFATVIDGVKQGFVTHPSPSPDGLLYVWTGTENPIGTQMNQAWQGRGRICLLPGVQTVSNAANVTVVHENPQFSYTQPRAVVPRSAPPHKPWLPNAGVKWPTILPKGTPFALIGSASSGVTSTDAITAEWIPWSDDPSDHGGQIPTTVVSGDIHYVRVILTRPTPKGLDIQALNGERLEILADVPIRHVRLDGSVPIDGSGQPDTSWLAKIPGDTPFTLAALNANKEMIALARTWHVARPGEGKFTCGNCHRHVGAATAWDSTLAFRFLNGNPDCPFTIADATHTRIIQRERDVQPTLTALNLTPVIYRGVAAFAPSPNNVAPCRALRSTLYTGLGPEVTAEQRAIIRDWIDSGASEGANILTDDLHPVLTVQSPNREQLLPISEIRFGAYDIHSGIASVSVKTSFAVQNRPAQSELSDLFTMADWVWVLAIPEQTSGEVTVKVTDGAGNQETLIRTFSTEAPPPPPDCEAQLAALQALYDALLVERNALRAKIEAAKVPAAQTVEELNK